MARNRQIAGWLAGCVAVLAAAGCGDGGSSKGRIVVYQYPDFYQPDLKRVAVLPFASRVPDRSAGPRISDKVSAILTNNRTYEVYTRQNLADLLAEKDLADAGIIDADTAMEIGRLKSVQALICGVCNRYEAVSRTEQRVHNVPIWGQDERGRQVIVGFRPVPYTWLRYDAFVECQVVVIDTQTGLQIAAVHDPTTAWAEGSPPGVAMADLLRRAEEDQVARIVQAIAVVRKEIKLRGDVLRTAAGRYDQKWDWQKKFTSEQKEFFVVVRLPPEADRNHFRIALVRKGQREDLAEQAFVWDKQHERFGYGFETAALVERGGFGDYEAKLYSGPEPIARYGFSLVAPKPEKGKNGRGADGA